ncbi:MAG: hypothetical protein ACT4O9_17335 [Blastocatellia bacterium]
MAKEDSKDLLEFLQPFDDQIIETVMWLRNFVWDLYPECNELIYDGPNALAFGWTPSGRTSDTFSTIAIYNNECVQFGFYWGSQLADPESLLEGKGKQYRFLRVIDKKDFPARYAKELLNEAHVNSLAKAKGMDKAPKGTTEVKSISSKKKRPAKH